MATVLTKFYQQRHDNYVSLKRTAENDLATASKDLKSALDSYQSAVAAGADLDTSIAAKRAKMSAAGNMPSEIEMLAEELRQLLIERRHNTATIADAAEALSFVQTAVATAKEHLTRLSGLLALANTDLAAAQQRQKLHYSWLSTETEDEITIKTEAEIAIVRNLATDLLEENPITVAEGETNPAEVLADATARVEDDIPEVLLTRARARAAQAANKLTGFQTHQASINAHFFNHGTNSNGSSGLLAQRWAEYEAAENNLRNYALTSVDQYKLALSLLTSITKSAELSVAEKTRITELALAADADEMTTEVTLQNARAAVDAQALTVELAEVAARVADVNADPADNPDVIAARDQLADLKTSLTAAKAEHTEEFAATIDLWEGAIPDAIWSNLQSYDSAIGILTALKASDATTLITAFNNAENALVDAATADDNAVKLHQALTASRTKAKLKTEYISSVQQAVERSAMRGDYRQRLI